MTTYKNGLTYGSGLFIDSKYPGEHHAHGYIRLDQKQNPKKREEVKDALDSIALSHDKKYKTIQDQYKRDHDNQRALKAVHQADEQFIRDSSNTNVQPLGKISAGIIKAKELAEKAGVLDSKTFSGLGNNKVSFTTKSGKQISFTKKHDPTARLKKLAGVTNPKKDHKQSGGIAPVLIPVISALAGTALGKIWDLVKEKIEGKGYSIDPELYKTDTHKRAFIKKVLY